MSTKPDDEFDLEEYRTNEGVETKTVDVSSDSHALKNELGTSDADKQRKMDATIGVERFVDLYESADAAIREMLANSESACLDRARIELRERGIDVPDSTSELLDKAKEVAGYEPQIDITYRRKPESTTFTLRDNGCGISTQRYRVIQNVGYSTSKDNENNVGMFGVGWYSTFTLCGKNDHFEMVTKSRRTDETYGTMEYLGNVEYLDRGRENYGTTFHVPAFCQSAKDIDVADAVCRYSKGLRCTVVYREFDESGEETDASEEYAPRRLEDDYSDDELVVTYEDDFFKAVMSPEDIDRAPVTLNISMPITRNVDAGYKSYHKLHAKWHHDVRVLREDGAICSCESDPSLVGKVPIEDSKYDKKVARQTDYVGVHMTTASVGETVDGGQNDGSEVLPRDEFRSLDCEASDEFVTLSELPDDAVTMPKPSSSRDGYERGNDDFWKHVSKKLMDAWEELAAERFDDLDDWDDFLDMSVREQEELVRAYTEFGPKYGRNDVQNVQDEIEETFDTVLSLDTCAKLDSLNTGYNVVEEGCTNPHHLSNTEKTNVRKILREYDEVYVGKTINAKRANLVWGMPEDTAVVRLKDESYDDVLSLWDWSKLSDVPIHNVREKLPQVDDDVLDEWADKDKSDYQQPSQGSSGRRTSRDPTTKTIKVRRGKRTKRKMKDWRVDQLVDKLSNDEPFDVCGKRHYTRECDKLVIFDQTELGGSTPPTSGCSRRTGIASTAVPKYVYKYLKDVDNVYESFDAAKAGVRDEELEQFPDNDAIVFAPKSSIDRYFDGDTSDFLDAVEQHSQHDLPDDTTVEFDEPDTYLVSTDDVPADIYHYDKSGYGTISEQEISLPEDKILAARKLPDCIDFDEIGSDEFAALFDTRRVDSIDFSKPSVEYKMQLVEELGELPSMN